MSQIWTFSPSSEPYLQRCLDAASLQQTENKWTQKFGKKSFKVLNKTNVHEEETVQEISEIAPLSEQQIEEDVGGTYDDFFQNIENEIRLQLVLNECTKNPDLITKMTERLSSNTVEKLFNSIFTCKDIETHFLTLFLTTFLPNYIKNQYSRLCIDLLNKTSEKYPEIFAKILETLIKDTEIPDQVVNNYISTFNEEKRTTFLGSISNIEISLENFIHNLFSIYLAYKDCMKTEKIQYYIKSCLIQHSESCKSDKNYGKLFMTYLQAERSLGHKINTRQLEECLEIHKSPFKRPCVLLLKEIENKIKC